MDLLSIAIIAAALLLFSLVSRKLQGTVITAPLVFVVFGILVGARGLDIVQLDQGHSSIHFIAELTLILVLFTDAARIDLKRLRRDHNLPVRMLLFGLPLAIAAGTLPAVLLFAALASAEYAASGAGEWIRFGALQLTLGPLTGVIVGFVGARGLDTAAERRWASESFQGIGILSLAVFTYVTAELLGGNGFIAAFIGGMVFGNTIRHPCTFLFEFMETEGQLLMLITFLVFGAVLLPEGLEFITPMILLYAVLSLTVIRMIPIAISLIGAPGCVCQHSYSSAGLVRAAWHRYFSYCLYWKRRSYHTGVNCCRSPLSPSR